MTPLLSRSQGDKSLSISISLTAISTNCVTPSPSVPESLSNSLSTPQKLTSFDETQIS